MRLDKHPLGSGQHDDNHHPVSHYVPEDPSQGHPEDEDEGEPRRGHRYVPPVEPEKVGVVGEAKDNIHKTLERIEVSVAATQKRRKLTFYRVFSKAHDTQRRKLLRQGLAGDTHSLQTLRGRYGHLKVAIDDEFPDVDMDEQRKAAHQQLDAGYATHLLAAFRQKEKLSKEEVQFIVSNHNYETSESALDRVYFSHHGFKNYGDALDRTGCKPKIRIDKKTNKPVKPDYVNQHWFNQLPSELHNVVQGLLVATSAIILSGGANVYPIIAASAVSVLAKSTVKPAMTKITQWLFGSSPGRKAIEELKSLREQALIQTRTLQREFDDEQRAPRKGRGQAPISEHEAQERLQAILDTLFKQPTGQLKDVGKFRKSERWVKGLEVTVGMVGGLPARLIDPSMGAIPANIWFVMNALYEMGKSLRNRNDRNYGV